MIEKMTWEKAWEIIGQCHCPEKCSHSKYCQIAKAFIDGWNAHIEFEAERNGKPKDDSPF